VVDHLPITVLAMDLLLEDTDLGDLVATEEVMGPIRATTTMIEARIIRRKAIRTMLTSTATKGWEFMAIIPTINPH